MIILERVMKGIVLHFDGAKQNGVIRADDGRRYGFTGFDYKSDRGPRVGDEIDFEIQDGVATEIYALKAAASPPLDMLALRRTITDGTTKVAEQITRNWAGSAKDDQAAALHAGGSGVLGRIMSDWRNVLAALALIACFFPALSVGPFSTNLFGVVSYASLANGELAAYQGMMQPAPAIAPTPWNMTPPSASVMSRPSQESARIATMAWTLRAAYLLYLIPILAIVTLVQMFRGRDNFRPAFWLGIACSALFPAAVIGSQELAALKMQMPMFVAIPGITSILDFGFYGLIAAGFGTLLVHAGIIGARPPRAYISLPA
jgi:hypothetical protein